MRTRNLTVTLTLALTLALGQSRAQADPIIIMKTAAQFQAALSAGFLTGVDPSISNASLTGLQKAYPTQSAQIRNTQLGVNSTTVDGLISATGTGADLSSQIIGGYAYKGSDPDWTGNRIDLDIFLPAVGPPLSSGIDNLSFAIIDTSGRIRLWQWNDTALASGLQNFLIPFDDGLGAGGSTFFLNEQGFDLTHSESLLVGYRGTLTNAFAPVPPTLDPLPNPSLWIGTKTFAVPEPGAWLCLPAAFLGFALLRRKP